MNRDEIVTRLRDNADAVRRLGATSLYLFGSVARDQAREDSDIDLFIDYDADTRFSLVELAGIKQFLENAVAAEVDVMTRDSLHPLLKDRIEQSAIRIF